MNIGFERVILRKKKAFTFSKKALSGYVFALKKMYSISMKLYNWQEFREIIKARRPKTRSREIESRVQFRFTNCIY